MWRWKLKQSGLFTINSLYQHLTGFREDTNCFRWIWTTQAPLKINVHMWLSFHDRLLTVDNLAKRGIHFSSCLLCGVDSEITAHIFLHCPFNMELWVPERNRLALSSWPSFIATLWGDWRVTNIPHIEANRWNCVVSAIIWVVWGKRNQWVFKAKSSSIMELGGRIFALVTLWQAQFPIRKFHKPP